MFVTGIQRPLLRCLSDHKAHYAFMVIRGMTDSMALVREGERTELIGIADVIDTAATGRTSMIFSVKYILLAAGIAVCADKIPFEEVESALHDEFCDFPPALFAQGSKRGVLFKQTKQELLDEWSGTYKPESRTPAPMAEA